jgi:ribosomal protein L37E
MKAKDFLNILDEEKQELMEWACPECGAQDLPDSEGQCPECGFQQAKQLFDDRKKYWESIYNKVFSKIHGKLMEGDLKGTNTVQFVTKLREMGIIRRLRSGRFVEVLKIPKEFVVSSFMEGKDGMKRLRKMAWRRKQKPEYRAKPWQIL